MLEELNGPKDLPDEELLAEVESIMEQLTRMPNLREEFSRCHRSLKQLERTLRLLNLGETEHEHAVNFRV